MGYSVYYDGQVTITPPLSEEHAAIVIAIVNHNEIEETRPILAAIAAGGGPTLPRYGGLFDLSEERDEILPEQDESRQGLGLTLKILQEYFFVPHGYALNGAIDWNGDDPEDRGCIYLKDDLIEGIEDSIVNGGPSWAPIHYADEPLIVRLQELVESADNAGCSPELTVVEAQHIDGLRDVLRGLGVRQASKVS